MSKYINLILFIRFLGYFILIWGSLGLLFVLGPLLKAEFDYRFALILGYQRSVPKIVTSDQEIKKSDFFGFSDVKAFGSAIVPVDTQFGIVIEKLNANAKIIKDVDPANEKEYLQALKEGVAHAKGTNYPGEKGNIYLFSHSTDAPWNIIRFNAIFYLLRELEPGDNVVVFYNNKRFDYIVFEKVYTSASDTSYLTNKYNQSILTLQTCDPPGTLLNRLIVKAKLAGV